MNLDICDTRAHLGDILVTTSKENGLPFAQFPSNRPWNFYGSHFRGECNFDVQGSHESFVFDLMHSHSEEGGGGCISTNNIFKAVSVQIVQLWPQIWFKIALQRKSTKKKTKQIFTLNFTYMHIAHFQITVLMLIICLILILLDDRNKMQRWM